MDQVYRTNGLRRQPATTDTSNRGETLLWRSDQTSKLYLTCHDKGLYTAP